MQTTRRGMQFKQNIKESKKCHQGSSPKMECLCWTIQALFKDFTSALNAQNKNDGQSQQMMKHHQHKHQQSSN